MAQILGIGIVLWCNGSTAVFGSACPGSNPGKTTHKKMTASRRKADWLSFFI